MARAFLMDLSRAYAGGDWRQSNCETHASAEVIGIPRNACSFPCRAFSANRFRASRMPAFALLRENHDRNPGAPREDFPFRHITDKPRSQPSQLRRRCAI